MSEIIKAELPQNSLLQSYVEQGDFTDCYTTDTKSEYSFEQYIEAFYTTRLFKLERFILKLISKPSTDEQAWLLAKGEADSFAAWSVESREKDQILLCDFQGKTRSWLMLAENELAENHNSTKKSSRLYFGSAVVKKPNADPQSGMGWGFNLMLGFHKIYSVALLKAAKRKLESQQSL